MNVSDEDYRKMKSAIIASLKESIGATRTFELNEKQIIEFCMKHSIHITNCCLVFPEYSRELIKLQRDVFNRHCILIDVHREIR